MCTRVTCETCGKPSWRGCGAHVESVLRDVPPEKRCQCKKDRRGGVASLLGRLFGGGR